MSNIEMMVQAIEFVEANLKEPIGVGDMASAVSFSLYHFCRTFNALTHHTPYDYLMRRRLAESAWDLLRTDRRTIEIAGDYQFNNPETFSRAFRRVFDMQPTQWRKQGSADRRRVMPRLTLAHLQHIAKGAYLRPVPDEHGVMYVAGLMTRLQSDRAVISELWDLLGREWVDCAPLDLYGIAQYPADWENHGVLYMAGVRIPAPDSPNPALVVKTLPAAKYVRFVHKGTSQELQLTLDYIYHTWQPKSGAPLSLALWIEHLNPDLKSPENAGSEREIYIPLNNSYSSTTHA